MSNLLPNPRRWRDSIVTIWMRSGGVSSQTWIVGRSLSDVRLAVTVLASSGPLMLTRPANGHARNVARRKYFVPSPDSAPSAGRGRIACRGTLVEVTGSTDAAGAVGGDIRVGGCRGEKRART